MKIGIRLGLAGVLVTSTAYAQFRSMGELATKITEASAVQGLGDMIKALLEEVARARTEGKKRTVALICYDGAPCPAIERMLGSKECQSQVDVVTLPAFQTTAELDKELAKRKLPADTLFLVSGHAQGLDWKSDETIEEWRRRVGSGRDHAMSRGRGEEAADTEDIQTTIHKHAKGAPIWINSCGAGGVCQAGRCSGGSCQADQLVTLTSTGGWVDPPTKALLNLVCDPKLRAAVDKDGDGKLEGDEMKEYFRCDAGKHPMVFTRTYSASTDEEAEEKIRFGKMNAAQYLHQHLTIDTKRRKLEHFTAMRADLLQDTYRDTLLKGGPPTVEAVEKALKFEIKRKDGSVTVTARMPDTAGAACYFSGMEPMSPAIGDFEIHR